jgi:PPOX class probable F420-dependent enzyme
MAQLSAASKDFLAKPYLAHIATVSSSGRPQLSVVWVDSDGDDIVFNTAEGRAKARNLHDNPSVAVSVLDPNDNYNLLLVQGTVVAMEHEGADEHIDFLAKKYLGAESYPFRNPAEQRVKVRIRPDKVLSEPRAEGEAEGEAEEEGEATS